MEMLKKIAETMSLGDISAHLSRKPARFFFLDEEKPGARSGAKEEDWNLEFIGVQVTAEKRKRSAEATLEERKRAGQRPGSPLHQPTVPSDHMYDEETRVERREQVKRLKWPEDGKRIGVSQVLKRLRKG